LTDDLSNWVYNSSRLIQEIEVFQSITYSNPNAKRGLAVLDPHEYIDLIQSTYDTILPVSGKVEKQNFIRLQENVDYNYDFARGFINVFSAIPDYGVLAVSYKTDLDTIGTFYSEFTDTTKVPVFRLIKSRRMGSWHSEVWPLMMKNVYFLGDSMSNHECFNISIEYNLNGEHETIQPVDPKKSYMYLMGLDWRDENGVLIDGGDGTVDRNILLINMFDGTLLFPGLHPFNPLPQSRFQIAETADLYNTTNIMDLNCNYRYDIVVTLKIDE